MNITEPNPPIVYSQIGSVEKSMVAVVSSIHKVCGGPPQRMFLVNHICSLIATKRGSRGTYHAFVVSLLVILVIKPRKCQTYSAIKTYCETMHMDGMMTQFALSRHVARANKQYCGSLGLKINAKVSFASRFYS